MKAFPEAAELQERLRRLPRRVWEDDALQAVVDILEVVKRIDTFTTEPEQPEHPELSL